MPDGRGTVREIVWQDICPGLLLVRVFRLAIKARVLLLAVAALALLAAGDAAIDGIFSSESAGDWQPQGWHGERQIRPWQWNPPARHAGSIGGSSSAARELREQVETSVARLEPVYSVWAWISAPFLNLFRPNNFVSSLAVALLTCLWTVAVCALFAGAITRIAAVALAREEHLGARAALQFAWSKFASYFFAPISPLAALLIGMLLLAIPSLLMRFSFFLFLGALLWPLLLVIGFLFAVLLLGVWFGWPLMWAAISTESQSDAFEGLNRAYAYVYQRPLYYLALAIAAGVLGLLGVIAVNLFASVVLHFSYVAVAWGVGAEQLGRIQEWVATGAGDAGWFTRAGAGLIAFWETLVITLAAAFHFSFFWVAAEAIYLVLRRSVDATEMDQVFLEDEQAYGLPQLETDAAGVPGAPEPEVGGDGSPQPSPTGISPEPAED